MAREEIQRQLWNGTTFVDFEHGLNAAINKLRQTLGDSAEKPRYIETIPGRGYRFVGATQEASPTPVSEKAQVQPVTPEAVMGTRFARSLPKNLAIAVVFGIAVLAVGVTLMSFKWNKPNSRAPSLTPPTVRFRISIPDTLRLSGSGTFSISPDGSTLVYQAAGRDGVFRLWAQGLNSLEPKGLAGTESTDDPPVFWSPDSKQLAFYTNGKLMKTDLTGGAPQTLCAVPAVVSGGAWNRNGVIIFGPVTGPLMRVAENGGQPVAITALDALRKERTHLYPTFLPDGRHFVYSRISSVGENSGIYLGSLDAAIPDQEKTRLVASAVGSAFVSSPGGDGKVLYQVDDELWERTLDTMRLELEGKPMLVADHIGRHRTFGFFSASESGALVHRSGIGDSSQLEWFDRRGARLASVGGPLDLESTPALSPDGTHVAVTKYERGVDIWVYDLASSARKRITSNPALDTSPVWSPDGTQIAFSSSRNGHYDLYRTKVAGEDSEELLYASNEPKFPSSWSKDGRFLLYQTQGIDANWDIWVLPLAAGGGSPVPLIHTQANEHYGQLSPDGRWIVYVSDESGTNEVYVKAFSPAASGTVARSEELLVSRGGGSRPDWRADGREIFYQTPDGVLMSIPVKAEKTIRASPPQPLFRTSLDWFSRPHPTADGSRFLIATPVVQALPQSFTVVLNWQSELTRPTAGTP